MSTRARPRRHLSRRPLSAILLAAAAVVAGLLVPAPAPAAAVPGTAIAGITLTAGDTSLVGAQLTTLTVRLHLTDPTGVWPSWGTWADTGWSCPCLVLSRVRASGSSGYSPQAWWPRIVQLHLAAGGTPQDGVWVGATLIGAVDGGSWTPSQIYAGTLTDTSGSSELSNFAPVDPAVGTRAALAITGTDWPVLTIVKPPPTPAGTPYVMRGTMTLSRSHRPVLGARIVLRPNLGLECYPFSRSTTMLGAARTSRTGAWSVPTTALTNEWCADFAPDRVRVPVQQVFLHAVVVRATISVRPSASFVHTGSAVTLVTTERGVWRSPLVVQRYSNHAWRTFASRSVARVTCAAVASEYYPAACVYRLSVKPTHGTYRYRVVAATSRMTYGGVSRAFALTAC